MLSNFNSLFLATLICFPACNSKIVLSFFYQDNPKDMVLAAGLIEEPLKLSVLYFFIRKRKMFNEPMDAIVSMNLLFRLAFAYS